MLVAAKTQYLLGFLQQLTVIPGVLLMAVDTSPLAERRMDRGHGETLILIEMTREAECRHLLFHHQLLAGGMGIVAGGTPGFRRGMHELLIQDILEVRMTGETQMVAGHYQLDRARGVGRLVAAVTGCGGKGSVFELVDQPLLVG